jgi:hypothetical protein
MDNKWLTTFKIKREGREGRGLLVLLLLLFLP